MIIINNSIRFGLSCECVRKFICIICLCVLLNSDFSIIGGTDVSAAEQSTTINIGVLARRGIAESLQVWSPTADYLTERVPGVSFQIVPLTFGEVAQAVFNKQVDFVIVNPYIYVELQNLYGVSRMATLKRLTAGGHTALFGGSIFCRKDQHGINTIEDLKGHTFAAVDETSFGGWMVAWREIKEAGIDPYKDFTKLTFSGTHDEVVLAVRDGRADAGTVATPILEQMIAEGKITTDTFKILNRQEATEFSDSLSTRLYPEWPFSRLKHTPEDIAEKVAIALLAMPQQSAAARAALSAGWTVPFDYYQVQACMQYLQVGIYKDYGKITLSQLFSVYRWQSFSVLATMIILGCLLWNFGQLNRKLKKSEIVLRGEMQERQRANDKLTLTNESLSQSRQELSDIIDFLPDATFVVDLDKKVISWNRAMEHMTGVTKNEMIGQGNYAYTIPFYGTRRKQLIDLLDLDDEELRTEYQNIIRKGTALCAETFAPSLNNGKGATVWVTGAPLFDTRGTRVGAIESIRDITAQKKMEEERKKLQEQLLHSQKLEAIGTLAGGIAHDFNNILGAIVGYAEMIRDDLPPGSPNVHDIKQVLKASHRAKDLVKQILAFSRQVEDQKILMQPALVTQEAISLLRASLPATIIIKQDIDPDTGMVLADPTQIHQIVMNLATNAFHAMEVNGGTLTISLQKKKLSGNDLTRLPELQPGAFVQLSIRDTGPGIPPDIRDRIFDPFFTTKEVGKGTGLGLSMVYSIIKSCHGAIVCDSRIGEGTDFRILLPTVEGPSVEEKGSTDLIPLGEEHILLVDDEEMLAELGQVMLQRLGYHVTTRRNSLDALTTFQNQPDAFDLIITDQTMPGMTGIDLGRRILQIRPEMPIILCTGYSSLISEEKAKAAGITGFAYKPLAKKEIGALIRKVLDEKNPLLVVS